MTCDATRSIGVVLCQDDGHVVPYMTSANHGGPTVANHATQISVSDNFGVLDNDIFHFSFLSTPKKAQVASVSACTRLSDADATDGLIVTVEVTMECAKVTRTDRGIVAFV